MYLGLAGVLPYLATSIVTATMSYQTKLAIEQGHTTMFTPETVHRILDVMEPIQIGYGAVVSSCHLRRRDPQLLTTDARFFRSLVLSIGALSGLGIRAKPAWSVTCPAF